MVQGPHGVLVTLVPSEGLVVCRNRSSNIPESLVGPGVEDTLPLVEINTQGICRTGLVFAGIPRPQLY